MTEKREKAEAAANDHLLSRRSAMQLLGALGGVGAFSRGAVADEQSDDGSQESGNDGRDEESNSARPVGTEELLRYLAARYGDLLSEEDIEALEEDVADNLGNAEALDAVELDNGDDLAVTFEAYRGSY